MIDLTERVGAKPIVRGTNPAPGVQVSVGGSPIPFEQADMPKDKAENIKQQDD